MSLHYDSVTGADIAAMIPDLARLRGHVFRDWPYLYEADEAYERRYLAHYTNDRAIIVTARQDGRLVGAATGMPLLDHVDNLSTALLDIFEDLQTVFYCAESVLLSDRRGQGAGHVFFDHREAHARSLGFIHSVFCAVDRPETHPARPKDYRPLDAFWRKRGYHPMQAATAALSWRDIGDAYETTKPMTVWSRRL